MSKTKIEKCVLTTMLIFTVACAKGTQNAQDPGPQFVLESPEVKLSSTDSSVVTIKRNDPTSGPQMTLRGTEGQTLVSVERQLECGKLVLVSPKALINDPSMLNFRIADEEFKGLATLPIHAKCKLVVKTTNSIGSDDTRTYPITFNFDSLPPIEVSRQLSVVGANAINNRNEIALEIYTITNPTGYNVGFTFTPHRSAVGKAHYIIKLQGIPPGQNDMATSFYSQRPTTLVPTRIDLTGDLLNQSGDLVESASFSVIPNGTVTLISYGQVSPNVPTGATGPCASFPIGITSQNCERDFLGIYVTQVQDAPSLTEWQDFDKSDDDKNKPVFVTPTDTPIPGITKDDFLAIRSSL